MRGQRQPEYGYRGKLGLIVPATNSVNEAEWARFMPQGVSFHTTRLALHSAPQGEAEFDRFRRGIASKVLELMPARVNVTAFACTAGSMIVPPEKLSRSVEELSDLTVITTAQAIIEALGAIGARRIAIATPYDDRLVESDRAFYAGMGIEVAGVTGLGLSVDDHVRVPATPLAKVRELAIAAVACKPDALLITCTDVPCMLLIPELEAELSLPVITSNQATLWLALRRAGIPDKIPELGRLFNTH